MVFPRRCRCVALSACLPMVCLAQGPAASTAPVATPAVTVYVNPRSGADDPRVGLKGGLYEAKTAEMGMHLIEAIPKPPGFAPDLASIKAYDAAPAPPPPPPGTPPMRGGGRPACGLWRDELGPGVQRQGAVQRKLQRDQFLRYFGPDEGEADYVAGVSGRPGRCVGVWASAVYVGGGCQWAQGLRDARLSDASGRGDVGCSGGGCAGCVAPSSTAASRARTG